MEEKFVIKGGKNLSGEVEIGGYKNAAGPALAAILLTQEECRLGNMPLVEDVFRLVEVLKGMGVKVAWTGKNELTLEAGSNVDPEKMDPVLVSKSRISVLLIGALAARFKDFKIARPGGDRIGVRPINTHLKALEELGVESFAEDNFYHFRREELRGKEIILKEFSVTATENLLLAAVLAKGETVVKGAACEPQVQDLCWQLIKMGAKIEGVGTHTLKIEGQESLSGASHNIIPDVNEAATFIVASAFTKDRIKVINAIPDHLDLFLDKMQEAGVNLKKGKDFVEVFASPEFKAVRIQALPFPGFATDFLPLTAPLLTQAKGKSLVHDPLYENRLNYTQELKKMGADIEVVDPHRVIIFGKTPLSGVNIQSWDIRAGASLVIAGLIAQGTTVVENIYQIDRGYEKMEEKLQKLGADIQRRKG
ncbi:MAG: UDP-N-acetylglucosamine 1-carboxyvinyltransferase [Candidatus Paceibacterota bacterium]|jgi:UDP-N-acetylglucosamine 1-carboxyvinyltransferase